MGISSSKIKYYNIKTILGPNFINNKLNEYIIIYDNGDTKKIRFTKEKERLFKNDYNYSQILKLIVFIKYSKINNIKNFKIFADLETNKFQNDDIYSFDIEYIDNTTKNMRLNKYQIDTFCNIFKQINCKKYNACKDIFKLVNKKYI